MSLGGEEHALRWGPYDAVVTQVGAGLRLLGQDGRDLVLPYAADEVRPRYRGSVLAPWPNRIADGRYSFGGRQHPLPLTEPEGLTPPPWLGRWGSRRCTDWSAGCAAAASSAARPPSRSGTSSSRRRGTRSASRWRCGTS